MRLFETCIPILLAIYLVWKFPRPFQVTLLPAFTVLVLIAHLYSEGYRWQMIPLYALTLMLTVFAYFSFDIKPAASYLTIGLLALFIALPTLLPVPAIPNPKGPYQVGTTSFELVDNSRKELYSAKDEARRFMIQVWYPAEIKTTDVKSSWVSYPDIYTPALSTFIDMPPFFLEHIALLRLPAYQNAQFVNSDKLFPIVLFSHGWKSFNAQSTGQAIELASRGFIVVAPQHTYGAIVTVFPDGTVAPNNPEALPSDDGSLNYETIARVLGDQWAEDMSFTLDQLEAQSEAASFFKAHIDFSHIGAYGHSTGGGAAIQFCVTDARCKAVLGMDPFLRPVSEDVLEKGISQPSFFMFSQVWVDNVNSRNNALLKIFRPKLQNNFGVIEINGTAHMDFSDLPFLSPIAAQLGLKGPLKGSRVSEIVYAYLIDFFEVTLNEGKSNLFENSSPFEEVKFIN